MHFKYRVISGIPDPCDAHIYVCIHKKHNFETGSQRTPVENKKRDLVTRSRDGNGNSGNKNIKTGLKEVKKNSHRPSGVCLSGDCLAACPCVLRYTTDIIDCVSTRYFPINEMTTLSKNGLNLENYFNLIQFRLFL